MGQKDTINLATITPEAYAELRRLDKKFIGTKNYLGIAYFWHHEYRHYLRDATYASRCNVHKKMLHHGLCLDGKSKAHEKLIKRYICKTNPIEPISQSQGKE